MADNSKAELVNQRLSEQFPEPVCELDHSNAFQLLIATILAAQATDVGVNKATPGLFARFPDPESLAAASHIEVEQLIGTIGLFRIKAERIIECSQRLLSEFDGEVPTEMEDLTSLAGVGRKTANVVRSVALGLPGLPVDTHVKRISNRLGIVNSKEPEQIESELNQMLDPEEWGPFSLRVILHGRRVCKARKPACSECSLVDLCPSAKTFG